MRPSPLVRHAALAACLLVPAARAAAQLPSASAAASGMGESWTAVARGPHAPAWNPAALGLPGTPRFAMLLGVRSDGGVDPIGLDDLARYDGAPVPDAVRAEWLDRIRTAGRLRLGGTGGGTPFALAMGRVALAIGGEVAGRGDVAPDAAELLLFGNAGRTGAARDLSFAGTDFSVGAVTTAAVSVAQPLRLRLGPIPDQHFAVGLTGKYLVGNAWASGRYQAGGATADPLGVSIDLPIVQSDSAFDEAGFGDRGHGWGLDLAAAWQGGPWRAAVVVKNVVNTFAWNPEGFYWRAGTATFDQDTSTSDFDARPLASAPAAVRARLDEATYARELALGGAWRVSRRLLLTADARRRMGEGTMNAGPEQFTGAGVELRPFMFLPLRGGIARADASTRVAAGVGVELPWFALNVGAARQLAADGSNGVVSATLQVGGR